MTFEEYVTKVEQLVIDYTKGLSGEELGQIHESIEESDAGCGNIAFTRLDRINVGTGATLHIGAGTTFLMNVLKVFS